MHRLWVPLAALTTLTTAVFPLQVHSQVSTDSKEAAQAGHLPERSADTPVPALTLAQAMALALQHSPELRAAQQDVQASEGAVIQAGARPNPELQTLMEDTRAQTRTTTVQLAQPIELGGKRAARVSAAQLAQTQVGIEWQARRAQVRADVTEAFFASAIAQERVRLAQASSELAARASLAVSKRVHAGKVSPVEETRAKVAQASVDVELLQARSEWRVAQQRLGSLMGQSASDLAPINWAPLVESTVALNPAFMNQQAGRLADAPALRQARLEVDRRRALTDLEEARRIPDITVTLGTKRSEELGRNQAVIGLALPLPLWDRNQGNVLQAMRLQDKAEADLAAMQIRVDNQWTQLTERYQAAHAEVQTLQQDVLPGAQSAWQAAVTGFELGKFSFLETLDAQRTLFQARAQYLRALAEMHRTAADIDRLLGTEASEAPPASSEKAHQ